MSMLANDHYSVAASGHHVRSNFVNDSAHAISVFEYYSLAALTLLYYDHALTLPSEIRNVWRQKLSLISILFLVNRYLALVGYGPVLFFILNAPRSIEACTKFAKLPGALGTISQAVTATIMVMRTYALYQRNVYVLFVTSLLGMATVAASIWSLSAVKDIPLTFGKSAEFRTCFPAILKSDNPFKISWLLNMVFDTAIFSLTVHRTWQMCREHRRAGIKSRLAELVLRDGSIYYAVMAVANLINIVLFETSNATYFEQSAGNNSLLTNTISISLISRMILNLRHSPSSTARHRYPQRSERSQITRTVPQFTTEPGGASTYGRTLSWRAGWWPTRTGTLMADACVESTSSGSSSWWSRSSGTKATTSTKLSSVLGPMTTIGTIREEDEGVEMEERTTGDIEIGPRRTPGYGLDI